MLYRRELCDLNDPIEGPICLRIAGLSLVREPQENHQIKGENMLPNPNTVWKCKVCGEEVRGHIDGEFPHLTITPPKCPQCGGKMAGNPIVHQGPFLENPFKKY